MDAKKILKKLLIIIKLKINNIPFLRKIVIFILSKISPSFYSKLQNLKPVGNQEKNIVELIKNEIVEEKIDFSSPRSEEIFNDIKNAIK